MEYKNLPDLTSLATLVAVVEHGGVNEAARRLFVGQPAVTKRLRGLDACYGIRLMQRQGNRLELTVAGHRVYDFARLVLMQQRALVEDLSQLREGRDSLRLEVTTAIGEHLLPNLLLQFSEAYPQFSIQSRMAYSRQIQTHLATGLADLALLEQAPDHPDILVQKWLDDELLLVCSDNHPLRYTSLIALSELNRLNFVLRESSSSMRLILDKALRDVGIERIPVAMEVGSTDAIVEMLTGGKYVSFLPRFAVAEALADESLFRIKIEGLRIKRTLWIARTRSNIDNPAAEAFIGLLRHDR
jgi:DNA-binding transcriptional LysR family regulator